MALLANFKQLMQLVLPQWRAMVLGALFGCSTILANVGLLGTSAVLISAASLMPPILDLMVLIVGVRFFGISRGVFRYSERYFTHDLTFRLLSKIRVWFYHRLEPLVPAGLKRQNSGQLLKDMVQDVDTLKFFYLRVLAAPVVAVLVLFIVSLFLWHFSPKGAAVFAGFYLGAGLFFPLLIRKATKSTAEKAGENQTQFVSKLVEYVNGLADLLCYGQEVAYRQKLLRLEASLAGNRQRLADLGGFARVGISYLANLALAAALLVTIPLVSSGQLSGIYLAMVVLVVWAGFEAILPMPEVMAEFSQSMVAAGNLLSVIQGDQPTPSQENPPWPKLSDFSLVFDHLSFGYQPNQQVLNQLSFTLAFGQHLAIVGKNGAGKSSLVKVLFGFYPYEQGSIRLGGAELKTLPLDFLRSNISYLEQSPYLFHTTIAENLLLAKPDATPTELRRACQKANIWQFIESLPKKMETPVGANGLKLSGGQRQRLALARIFLEDRPIVILDEGTQGLDDLAKEEILAELLTFCKNKSLIFITHSLGNLAKMDQILVLEQGTVLEAGTEAGLLATQGVYSRLWQLEHQRF